MCVVTVASFPRKRKGWISQTLSDVKHTDLHSQGVFLLGFTPNEEETDTVAFNCGKQEECFEWSFTR